MMSSLLVWIYMADICGILYLLGFIVNVIRAIWRLRKAATKWQSVSSCLYSIAVILAAIYGVMDPQRIYMGAFLIKENYPFALLIASFPILDYFSSVSEEDLTISFLQSKKKVSLKTAVLVWGSLLIVAMTLPQILRGVISYQKNKRIEESL